MTSFFHYFLFCCKATTHHGVHSPFIFQLITNCFFNSEWLKIRRLPITADGFHKMDLLFKKLLKDYFAKNEKNRFTLTFKNELKIPTAVQPDENSIWVFSGIHTQRKKWLAFSYKENVRLDFFYWGILLFKTDQAKETFLLRIF